MMYAGCTTLTWVVTGVDLGDPVFFDTSAPDANRMTTQLSIAPKCSAGPVQGALGECDLDYENSCSDDVVSELDFDFVNVSSPINLISNSHNSQFLSLYISDGMYRYTSQLLQIMSCKLMGDNPLPTECRQVVTPLRWREWEKALCSFPDHQLVACLLQGLRSGFRIGFDYRAHKVKIRPGNLKSALDNPGPVEEYLHKELQMGRVQELPVLVSNKVHTSKFGVIPKSNQPGKWRLILDLSSPSGASVNDGISKDLCSMHYATLDEALAVIVDLGPGALLAKIDIKEACRNIPVHPDDRPLLGMAWGGRTYIDCQLPFGLRSAPLLFSVVADVLEWIVLVPPISKFYLRPVSYWGSH